MQNSALEAEVQRLKRQETANFAAFKRVTEEKLSYMQKLAEAEGEAFMSTVLLRKVSLPPPRPPPRTPAGGGVSPHSQPLQARSESSALQTSTWSPYAGWDNSPVV
jgi:hypothetical protein